MAKPFDFQLPPKGITEILVHGVGGATPQDILGDPNPTQVAGDDRAGFYRPSTKGPRNIEAYSWGGLTSKGALRSLWVLLLPFTLVNVGGWMIDRPGRAEATGRWHVVHEWLCGAQERLVRILGLVVTVAFVMWGAALWVDLVSYQCGAAPECFSGRWWLSFWNWSVFDDRPQRRVIVGLAVPLLMLLLVALLGRRSRRHYDERRPPEMNPSKEGGDSEPSGEGGDAVDLTTSTFWYRPSLVKDMAGLHGAGAMAALAALTAYSINEEAFDRSNLLTALAILAGVLGLVSGVLVGAVRLKRGDEDKRPFPPWVPRVLECAAGAILAAVALYVWSRHPFYFAESTGSLRGFSRAPFYLAALAIVIALLIALCQAVRRSLQGHFQALVILPVLAIFLVWPDAWILYAAAAVIFSLVFSALPAKPQHARVRWVAPAATSLAGMLILSGSFAGGAIRLADFLDRRQSEFEIELPVVYSWVVVGFGVCLVSVLLACLLRAARVWYGSRGVERVTWPPPGGGDQGDQSIADAAIKKIRRRILLARGLVQLGRDADLLITFLTGFMCLGAIVAAKQLGLAGAVGDLVSGHSEDLGGLAREISPPTWAWLVTASTWLASMVPLAAVILMQRAYSSERIRRQVGILWDLGTFWPRRYHPFAPPAYAERAVPELQRRIIEATNGTRRLILTGHSQGSVLGLAALASLPGSDRANKIVFATHGSPLGSLYRRFFPAYFRSEVFDQVESNLRNESSHTWCNFYRPTDPIAGPIFPASSEDSVSENGDKELVDPWRWWRGPGQSVPTLQLHSYYMTDPAMKKWIDESWPGFEPPLYRSR